MSGTSENNANQATRDGARWCQQSENSSRYTFALVDVAFSCPVARCGYPFDFSPRVVSLLTARRNSHALTPLLFLSNT